MLTEYRQVNPSNVSDIRNRVAALKLTIADIDQILSKDELWMSLDDLPLWETIIDRVNEVSTLLRMFNNTSDPTSPTSSNIRDRVYQLTALTRSLQRSVSTQKPIKGTKGLYRQLQSNLERFYLRISDLNNEIGEFE